MSARSHKATSLSGGVWLSATMSDRRLQRDDARDAPLLVFGGRILQVGHLTPADDLHPVGVDVVQVADQVGGRLRVAHGRFVETPLRVGVPGDPFPAQCGAVFLEQRFCADDGGFHAEGSRSRHQATDFSGSQLAISSCTLPASAFGLQALAQFAVAQHLGDLGQDLEVTLGGRLGHQQKDQQADGFVVGCIERNGLLQAHHGGQRVLQALDAAMRNGHAVAQAGGAQAFAGEQVVGDRGTCNRMLVFEQQACVLERALLAGGLYVNEHVAERQDRGKSVHLQVTSATGWSIIKIAPMRG
jgi:hypothetical protein